MSAPVKPEDLTDEMIQQVARTAVGALYLDCLDATSGGASSAKRHASRARICDAINARVGKEG